MAKKNTKLTREQLTEHRRTHTKQNSWWLCDAKGIPCCRVCPDCIDAAKATYRIEIFDESAYEDAVEERIEEDH